MRSRWFILCVTTGLQVKRETPSEQMSFGKTFYSYFSSLPRIFFFEPPILLKLLWSDCTGWPITCWTRDSTFGVTKVRVSFMRKFHGRGEGLGNDWQCTYQKWVTRCRPNGCVPLLIRSLSSHRTTHTSGMRSSGGAKVVNICVLFICRDSPGRWRTREAMVDHWQQQRCERGQEWQL